MMLSSRKRILVLLLIAAVLVCSTMFFACEKSDPDDVPVVPVKEDPGVDDVLRVLVTFDSNGGSEVSEQRYEVNSRIDRPSDPTKENYTFLGWYTDSLFSRQWNFSSDVVTSSVVLYAKWKPANKILIFNSDYTFKNNKVSFTLPSTVDSLSLTGKIMLSDDSYIYQIYKGDSVTSLGEPIGTTGQADMTGLSYGNNSFIIYVTDPELNYKEHFILSIYRTPVYIVRFYGLDDQFISETTASEGESISLPTYTPAGYDVSYWSYGSKKVRPSEKLTVSADTDLRAVCVNAVYSVSLNANGGTVSTSKKNVTYGDNFSLPIPSRDGFYFLGWQTEGGVDLTGSNGNSLSAWYYTNVFTAYAVWEAYSYTFTLRTIVDNVTVASEATSVSHGVTKTLSIDNVPVNTSSQYVFYVFCGWYDGSDLLSLKSEYKYENVSSSATVDAVWSTITVTNVCEETTCLQSDYRVKAVREADIDNPDAKKYAFLGETVVITSACNDTSHSFVGWQGSKTGTERSIKLIASSEPSSLECCWMEYTLQVISNVATDWIVTKQIGEENAVLTVGDQTPVCDESEVSLSVAPSSNTAYTFAGWYQDDNYSVLVGDSVTLTYSFTMGKQNRTVYAKWISSPLQIVYLNLSSDPTISSHSDISLDYGKNYCGGNFTVSASVDTGYYYGGIFVDESGSTPLTDMVIPSSPRNLYVKVTKTPFVVIGNIAGAGKIDYRLTEVNDNVVSVKATNVCSGFGKECYFESGLTYRDVLSLNASTFNGYSWLGWYYVDRDDVSPEWRILTNRKSLEIKMSGQRVIYRATWKKIETNINIRIVNDSVSSMGVPGEAKYTSKIDSVGIQHITMTASVNPGFCFDGWYVKKFSYNVNDPDSFVSEGKVLLSYDKELTLSASDLTSYDLTTIEAHFSELTPDYIYLRNSSSDTQKRMVCSVDGVFNAYFTGYYRDISGNAVLYQQLTIEIESIVCTQTLLRNEILVGMFSNVYLAGNSKNQDIANADIPGLDRSTAAHFDSENNTVTYVFNMNDLYAQVNVTDEYPLLFNYQSAQDNDTTTKPVSVVNTTTGEGDTADKILISSYKTFTVMQAVPARGNVFLYWEILDTTMQQSNDESNPNPSYSTDPIVYRNDLGNLTYTAHWKQINDNDSKIYAVKNIEAAGETFISGYSEKATRSTYNMVVNFSATTNNGYTFKGWYDDEGSLISADESFSIVCSDLSTYFGEQATVVYYACWAEMSAHVLIDTVAEYSLTGFVDSAGEIYYTVLPVSDIYFNGDSGYFNGYYFFGWYLEDGTLYSADYYIENMPESSFPSKLFAKWSNTPVEILSEDMMRYFENVDISSFDISIDVSGRGEAAYCFSKSITNETVLLFYAKPSNGYKFNGWYSDSALNNESLISISDLYSVSMQELFYDSVTGKYTLKVKLYVSFITINVDINMSTTGISNEYTEAMIAQPTCIGYRQTGGQTQYKFDCGVKSGFAFVQWIITPGNNSGVINSFEPNYTTNFAENVSLQVVAVYAPMSSSEEYVVKNSSDYAGSALMYGYYASASERYYKFVLKPNPGYVFWKIVAESADNTIVYQYDNNSVSWSSAGGMITAIITDNSLSATGFSSHYKYTVYWQSVWQRASHFTEITEYVNHNSVYLTGELKETSYSTGLKNYVQTYNFDVDFDIEDYSFVGWYKKVVNENLTDIVFCAGSNVLSYSITAPDITQEFYCKWGYYTVEIDMSDKEQTTSPDGFSADVTFVSDDRRVASSEFVSEIGFAVMDSYDQSVIDELTRQGYEYSRFDLNGGEGGKFIYLVWKKLPVSGINTNFITAISLSDSSMPYRANVLFTDVANASLLSVNNPVADLNFGVGGEPIYCYYSYESGYGKAICDIGIERNGVMSDFVGKYLYADSSDRVNVTPYSANDTYIVFNRSETVRFAASEIVIAPQTVTSVQQLSYPTQYVNVNNVPYGLIFAGWYDNIDTRGKPYDFTEKLYGDLTLYAKWYSLQDYNTNPSQVLSLGITNVYPQNSGTFYFAGLSDAVYKLYLKTESTTMAQVVTVYNVNSSSVVKTITLRDSTEYYVPIDVAGGDLFRIEFGALGATGRIELTLIGDLPADGGTFRNIIPYLDDFSVTAKPFTNQTFLGWFDKDGNEVSTTSTVAHSETEIVYVLHNKSYAMSSFNIKDNIYLYGKFNYYSMKIINPETESGEYQYLGDLSVGSEIELRATPNGGFAFKEWMIYDPTTGEIKSFADDYRFDTDLRTAGDLSYSPEMSIYRFRMLQENIIFIVTWSTVNDETYVPNSYMKYDISYEEAYVNAPENRTTFYYTDPAGMLPDGNYLNTEPFVLNDPIRYETENGVTGHYVFLGWYYHDASGAEISLYNEAKKQYIFVPSVAQTYAQTGKVSVYAKWNDPIPEVTVQTDDKGNEYILLGEYMSSYVDVNSEEYSLISRVPAADGYYYSRDGLTKYYRYSETQFFRMEKLRWDILRIDNGQILLQAHELFMTVPFNTTTNQNGNIYANNWEYSYLREYLNGEFLTTVFNTFEINLIKNNIVTVNNKPEMGNPAFDDKSRYPWVAQNATQDYVYVLSYAEISNVMYGFNESAEDPCELREAGYTDYYDMVLTEGSNRKGYYWLRSPAGNETTVYVVDDIGRVAQDKNVSYSGYGIRPVIKLLAELINQ